MNDAANKHAVELDLIRSTRAGLSSTAAYVIIAVAGALLLFGCAAVFIGLPISNRAEERVIFEDRGVAFEVEAPPAIQIVEGPPIPPPVNAPEADEYQPVTLMNEIGDDVDARVAQHFGFPVAGSATFVGVAVSREAEREIYTWQERSIDGDFSCVGTLGIAGGSSSCEGGDLDNTDPSLGWGISSTNGGPETVDVSVRGLPEDARWIVFTTDTGWRIVAESADGFSAALWPDWDGLPARATAYDSDLNEVWTGSF